MDALKKAEEAKRQSEAAQAAATPPGLPELPSRLELLDDEFQPSADARAAPTPAAAAAPRQAAAGSLERERAAAQNVFRAKRPPPDRTLLLVGGSLALLAAAGIAGYVWWQLQPKGGLGALPATARTAPPPAPIAAAPDAPPPAAQPLPVGPAAAPDKEEALAAVPPTPVGERQPVATAAATPIPEPERPIRITKTPLKVHPLVASAYQAFQSGDLAAAQRDYRQVLKNDPKNTDALHGLASISLSEGRFEAAEDYYLRILEADPKDSAAQAGLIGLRGQVDPVQSESRLKNLLASQPDSPFLNFTLGNLYALQGRWNEAQQAYFRAYAADGENPDYQFNLAVSLDQLRQPQLALQYYRGALAAAAQRPAAFDREQAARRVSELQK
jgi:tetratricopeptide (TPR) repeat protein